MDLDNMKKIILRALKKARKNDKVGDPRKIQRSS